MIYIVHGDDISKSRILIQNQQRKLGIESRIEVDVTEITPENLYEKACSNDLFGNPPFIVLDITNAGRSNLEPFVKSMEKIPPTTTLIILSNKTLTKTNVFMKETERLKAKLNLSEMAPKSNIFNLIDAIFSKKRDSSYTELSKLMKDQIPPFEILSMIFYGLRTVSSAKFGSPSYKKMHDFVKRKASSQSDKFSDQELRNIFEKLRKLDMKSKLSEVDEELLVPLAIEIVLNS